ncbi:MAG: tRNA (N6-threonylcarbamoyladenosine(37)-N6)-methyltransferase TrmO [Archaeoglobaceae archaeon]
MSYLIKPVGEVRSNVKEPFLSFQGEDLELDENRVGPHDNLCELVIEEQYTELLDGIEDFSHILVLYWSHKADDNRDVTKVHPAGRKDYPLVGVFATRSPARPNPICATVVKLLERNKNTLKVEGLDAIDQSPIIDIKPYHPSFDAASEVKIPQWMKELTEYFS